MHTSKEIEALTGLLDFFSDRAEAHASFMVACFFGLFTWLAMAYSMKNMWVVFFSMLPYGLIGYICYHCLQRFAFYADMADKYRKELEKIAKPEKIIFEFEKEGKVKKRNLEEYRDMWHEKARAIPRWILKQPYRTIASIILLALPFAIVYLPKFVAYFPPNLHLSSMHISRLLFLQHSLNSTF
ncbi:MAG: hypothetical protein ACFFDC_21135 [Promethearchaeota archaeon]